MADNADEHMQRDIRNATDGRYIGGVRDKSAPTEIPSIVLRQGSVVKQSL